MFPKEPARRQRWAVAIRRSGPRGELWQPTPSSVLCSSHFAEECFNRSGYIVRLRSDAVPSVFSHRKPIALKLGSAAALRRQRYARRVQRGAPTPTASYDSSRAGQARATSALGGAADEHSYCLPPSKELRERLQAAHDLAESTLRKLRNALRREKRQRQSCAHLLSLVRSSAGDVQDDLPALPLE